MVILLVSPPGDLQIGLQALLKAHLDADVLAIGDVSSILNVIKKQKPDLVILDQDTQKDTGPLIVKEITAKWPKTHFIVLVNDDQGHNAFSGVGADLIVTKGLAGSTLVAEIKMLLSVEE